MPLHDWTRVDAGLFHDFHQGWTVALYNALNGGALPADYFALLERPTSRPIADVLTLELSPTAVGPEDEGHGGLAVAAAPPRADLTRRREMGIYAGRANRITIRHRHGRVVAVVEVVSPGNKAGRAEFRKFVEKSADLVLQGVHLLVIDPFPPGPRDPQGVHQAIWNELAEDEELKMPPGKTRTLASYEADEDARAAYVSFVGVGDPLPDVPLFLRPGVYVPAPLEASYRTTWDQFPSALRGLLGEGPESL